MGNSAEVHPATRRVEEDHAWARWSIDGDLHSRDASDADKAGGLVDGDDSSVRDDRDNLGFRQALEYSNVRPGRNEKARLETSRIRPVQFTPGVVASDEFEDQRPR